MRAFGEGAWVVAMVVVARTGGLAAVGWWASLRLVCSGTARPLGAGVAHALARTERRDSELRAAVLAVVGAFALLAVLLWEALAHTLGRALLEGMADGVVALAGLLMVSQVLLVTGQTWRRGRPGGRWSELAWRSEGGLFAVAYLVAPHLTVQDPGARVVLAFLASDAVLVLVTWGVLVFGGALSGTWLAPSGDLLGQVLRMLRGRGALRETLEHLGRRLDVVVVAVLADADALGSYAVARMVADIGMAPAAVVPLVMHGAFRREGARQSAALVPRLLPKALDVAAAWVALVMSLVVLVLPAVLGPGFGDVIGICWLLVPAMLLDAPVGVLISWLHASGGGDRADAALAAGVAGSLASAALLVPWLAGPGAALATGLGAALMLLAGWRAYRVVAGNAGVRLLLRAAPGPPMQVA